jgi:hypothetical protein
MDTDYSYINVAVTQMLDRIAGIGAGFDAKLQPVYLLTGVVMFSIACAKFMWNRDLSVWANFVVRYVQLMIVILASSQWMPLSGGYVGQMGSFAASAGGFDIAQLTPATVAVKALNVAWKMYSENMSWMRLIFGTTEDTVAHLLLLIGCLGTILLAIFMAAWIMLFVVVFKLASAIALLFLAFLMFDATRFMGAPGLARILAYGVQMLVMGLVCGLFFMTLDGLQMSSRLEVHQSIGILVVMFFFALLFKYTTTIAREQISGMPTMDLHDVGRAAVGAGAMMAGPALGALGAFAGARMGSIGSRAAGSSLGSSVGGSGGSGASGGSMMRAATPTGGGGGGGYVPLPSTAQRLLERPPIDTTWTESRDLPKSATRMLANQQKQLPKPE